MEATNTLNEIVENINAYKTADVIKSENDVRKFIIDKVLQKLWKFESSPLANIGTYQEEVVYTAGHQQPRCDYVLNAKCGTVVLEAKGPNEKLDSNDYFAQTDSYCKLASATMAILTNGYTWQFYFADRNHAISKTARIEANILEKGGVFTNLFDADFGVDIKSWSDIIVKQQESMKESSNLENVVNSMIQAIENPTDEMKRLLIRSFDSSRLTESRVEEYNVAFKAASLKVKQRIADRKLQEYIASKNRENSLQPEEFGVWCCVRTMFYGQYDLSFKDNDDPETSSIYVTHNSRRRLLLKIVGTVTESEGYSFAGIKIGNERISLAKPEDVVEHFGKIQEAIKAITEGTASECEDAPVEASDAAPIEPAEASV